MKTRQSSAAVLPDHHDAARSPSARQKTYEDLKALILGGRLRPAERLSETRLATALGVSRTPLREALMKLEKDGLVQGERNVGYTVTNLDVTAVCELMVVREALDACAAGIAAEVASAEQISRISGIIGEMEALRGRSSQRASIVAHELDLGLKIHEVIAESTGNRALLRALSDIYQQLRLALWLEFAWIDVGDLALTEHKAIADAIIRRDVEGARTAAARHVRSSIENMTEVGSIFAERQSSLPRFDGPERKRAQPGS